MKPVHPNPVCRRRLLSGLVVIAGSLGLPSSVVMAAQALSSAEPAGQGFRVRHTQGELSLPARPQRVAVFDISVLDILNALGVDAVIGVSGDIFPDYLKQYAGASYRKLGSFFEPDFEALNAAKPDLIITGGRSSAKYEQLAKMGPTIDLHVEQERQTESVYANTRLLGRLFGKEAEAERLIAKQQAAIETLRAKSAQGGKGLIVLVTGGRISAYGPGSRFGVLHDEYGVPPATTQLKVSNHGEAIGSEFILKTNPDWLFVIDRDAAIGRQGAAAQVLDNPLVKQTTAARKQQIVYLNPVNWYLIGAGIQSMQAQIEQLIQAYDGAQ